MIKSSDWYSYLNSEATVTAITSNRIFPEILPPKTTLEAITFRAADHAIDQTFEGPSGFGRSDYYIDAWATKIDEAESLANVLMTLLRNHSGSLGTVTVQATEIAMAPLNVYEDSVQAWRTTILVSVWHGEF